MKQADLRHMDTSRIRSDDMFYFERLTSQEARKLMIGYPNIDGEDTQNFSPKAKELVEIAEQYNGTLSGYVIPAATGRKDARISLNGLTITCSSKEMRELRKKLKVADHAPDALWVLGNIKGENLTKYKFFWD